MPHLTTMQTIATHARERRAYYLWAALRGCTLPGSDPITWASRHWSRDRGEGRAAYKALYRHWAERAPAVVRDLPR